MKTTMKKVLSMALALVLVLGMLPFQAFATGHAHQWIDSENGTHHVCQDSTCPATEEHTATTWRSDYTGHWKVCTVCNANFAFAPHDGATAATCTAKAHCSICNNDYGEVASHNMQETSAAIAATCYAKGKTAVLTCSYGCGTSEGGTEVPKTPHHDADGAWNTDTTLPGKHFHLCDNAGCGEKYDVADHVWEAATASTGEFCSVCRTPGDDGPLGSATVRVCVLMGGTSQNGGSFTITASSTKTANEILSAYLSSSVSTHTASQISSSYVAAEGSATQYSGNQVVTIAPNATYVLYLTPVSSVNNNQSSGNNGGSSSAGITVGFVPNYNTYNYATYVANNVAPGARVYSFSHNITRTGYTLEGWYYDAATTQRVPNDAVVTGNATFYAKWTQVAPYNVSVVIYTNGNKNTPTVTLDLYEWAQDGVITLADLQQAVAKHGIKANNNAGLSVYGPFTPNQWTSYVSHDYFRNSTERVSVNSGEATVLYAMVHNVKITRGTVDPYGAIADKTNPKTGDMIYAPMMVLGLSASALAVLFYLNKKRAF